MLNSAVTSLITMIPRPPSTEHVLGSMEFTSGLGDSAWLLYGLVCSMKPEVCVEIGSARGKSSCYIGAALKRNGRGKLYAIDPHMQTQWNDDNSVDTFSVMSRNLKKVGVDEQVEIVRKTSGDAAVGWKSPIDLLFIDGDHSYEGVKADWDLFVPFMTGFGVVVLHDTIWDIQPNLNPKWQRADMGVPRFAEELRAAGYPTLTIDKNFGVTLIQPMVGGVKLR